ncbi:hypothetical protein CDD82_2998 [Ophiocordyceps australis]|uniref:Uncharacterized protein n=1 Tax=Ophiocordyceps australis TaxID=1399860 RepID=A0A2C5ZT98_9HYPO|nr:hypothetical protein CDD82_2998 [Ophiocordyceps australis]
MADDSQVRLTARRQGHTRSGDEAPPDPSRKRATMAPTNSPLQDMGGDAGSSAMATTQDTAAAAKRRRHRSTGGFLLPDALPMEYKHPLRHSLQLTSKTSRGPRTPERPRQQGLDQSDAVSLRSSYGKSSSTSLRDESDGNIAMGGLQSNIDAAQIVQMALSLGETRRREAQRPSSRATPPRLVPLADGSSGSNLRQHLQQQRRNSVNSSPPSRTSSGLKRESSSRASHASGSSINISPSTAIRAQRAKQHLELLFQYRRLLDVLPPLNHDVALSSMMTSLDKKLAKSETLATSNHSMDRQYNPLQYIRNRKVRAREGKAIDGELGGFGDVANVKTWIDDICQSASSSTPLSRKKELILPEFPGLQDTDEQGSHDTVANRAPARMRRPRVDWVIEPCDLIADVYWLERDHHKNLIEDRNWCKMFPLPPQTSREMGSHATSGSDSIPDAMTKVDTGFSSGSARDRAKRKLQHIRAFPHRHTGSMHSGRRTKDLLRSIKDSTSDLSSSENEAKYTALRPGHDRTLTSDSNDLLEKQMLEMIARENRDRDLNGGPVDGTRRDQDAQSQTSSRLQSRRGSSAADLSDHHGKVFDTMSSVLQRPSPQMSEKSSEPSIRDGLSLPASPDICDSNKRAEEMANAQVSPVCSRPASPSRNRLYKIKNLFQESISGDAASGSYIVETEHEPSHGADSPMPSAERTNSRGRRQTSPVKKTASERPSESWKSHRRLGSLRHDDGGGLRNMLKSPRLDIVFRGGVSKLGDLLWKKDEAAEPAPAREAAATDESDIEVSASRTQAPKPLHDQGGRPSKHLLEAMPESRHTLEKRPVSNTEDQGRETANHDSRRSPRFERPRPSRLDVASASDSLSPTGMRRQHPGDAGISESDFYPRNDATRRASNMLMEATASQVRGRQLSRHWSIADQECSSQQTQLSRREIARLRALVLSSGIKAMEIDRRARQLHKPFKHGTVIAKGTPVGASCPEIGWTEIAQLSVDGSQLKDIKVAHCDLYCLAIKTLGGSIQASGQRWHAAADGFVKKTSPELERSIGLVRARLVDDLSDMTRKLADEADETSRDLALDQPLKIKHVGDVIDKMLRRRRRRLRWLRRGLWLMVEWLLVGLMWYVWFVVVVLRLGLGLCRGVWKGVRWLFWL